ncbi:MAG: DUF3857 domain-containing protein [Acidobacteriota bacterium]
MLDLPFRSSLSRVAWLFLGISCWLVTMSTAPLSAATTIPLSDSPWADEATFGASAQTVLERAAAVLPAIDNPYGATVLWQEATIHFDPEGRQTYRKRVIYRLDSRAGLEHWSTVHALYAPWHQARPTLRARVITPDATVRELDPSTLSEAPAVEHSPDIFSDARVLRAPLPGLRVGAVVETWSEVRDLEPFFAAGTTGMEYLVGRGPRPRAGRLMIDGSTRLPLRFGVRKAAGLEPIRTVQGDRIRLVFDLADVPVTTPPESFLPPTEARWPAVNWSIGADWQSVARAYAAIVDRRITDAGVERSRAPATTSTDRTTRIAELLAILHDEVRYTGLELGEASLVPASPEEVLRRGYGDCKDKSTLLVAWLRDLGIDAHVALLRASLGRDVEPQLPGLGTFNHAIVYVPGTGDARPLWIDPTVPTAQVGVLPAADQGRFALVAAPQTTKLIRTPRSDSQDNRTEERRRIELADWGLATIVETSHYTGVIELAMRESFRGAGPGEVTENLSTYASGEYLGELITHRLLAADDVSRPFGIELEVGDSERASTELERATVAIRLDSLIDVPEPLLADDDSPRIADFHNPFPRITSWRYEIVPPVGMSVRELPASGVESLGATTLHQTWSERDDGVVTAELSFDTGVHRLDPETFVATRTALRELRERDAIVLHFDHDARALLDSRATVEALALYRRLVEQHPDEAIHGIRLTHAWLDAGMGLAAHKEAKRLVEVFPDEPLVHWTRGWVSTTDAAGRRFGDGFDRAGAITAYRRALELDDEHRLSLLNLAFVLERNDAGVLHGPGAEIDEALDIYDRLDVLDPDLVPRYNQALGLYDRDRLDELTDLARRTPAIDNADLWETLALAAAGRTEEATARLRGNNAERFRAVLSNVVQRLTEAGRFNATADLFRTFATDRDASAAGRVAELYDTVRTVDELRAQLTDRPSAPLERFFLQIGGFDPMTDESLEQLFHPRIVDDALRSRAEDPDFLGGQSPEMLRLLLSTVRWIDDGNDAHGHRLRFTVDVPGFSEASPAFFVSRHEGRWVITAFDDAPWLLGREALDRLESGDVDGARQWLDWARDLFPATSHPGDPLAREPFVEVWRHTSEATDERMRIAASILMLGDLPTSDDALPVLRRVLDDASVDEQIRQWVAVALFDFYSWTLDHDEIMPLAERLRVAEPNSRIATYRLARALAATDQSDALTILHREMSRSDDFATSLVDLVRAVHQKDTARVRSRVTELTTPAWLGDEAAVAWLATVLNEQAWTLLYDNAMASTAIVVAERGAELTDYRIPTILHTLATAYALDGQAYAAHRTIRQAIELADLTAGDWIVFGRLAELFDLPAEAREYYQRIPEPPEPRLSTWALAQSRLQALR